MDVVAKDYKQAYENVRVIKEKPFKEHKRILVIITDNAKLISYRDLLYLHPQFLDY